MQIEVKNLFSTQVTEPDLPEIPRNCHILIFVDIGAKGEAWAEQFNFYVVTPTYLAHRAEVRWGRGYLVMPEFSWEELKRMLDRIIASVRADTWDEATRQLCCFLEWEYDGYTK